MSTEKRDVLVKGFPLDLKTELATRADEKETSLNDVAVELLADAMGVKYEPYRRRAMPVGNSPDVVFRMPQPLKRKLQARALRDEKYLRDVIIETLRDALGAAAPAEL